MKFGSLENFCPITYGRKIVAHSWVLDVQPKFYKHLVSCSCGGSRINSKQMGNMSYCRFENTYADLQECYDSLSEAGSIKEVEENANQYEKKYIRKLVELCKEIVADFGDEDEDEDDDE